MTEQNQAVQPEVKRYKRYPVVVYATLGTYMSTEYDPEDRARKFAKTLETKMTELTATSPVVTILNVYGGNYEGQTWNIGVYLIMFSDVTDDELADYAQRLRDAKVAQPAIDPPVDPGPLEIFVPDRAWVLHEKAEAEKRSGKVRKLRESYSTSGKVTPAPAADAADEIADDADPEDFF